jgi:hypothetical protein
MLDHSYSLQLSAESDSRWRWSVVDIDGRLNASGLSRSEEAARHAAFREIGQLARKSSSEPVHQ